MTEGETKKPELRQVLSEQLDMMIKRIFPEISSEEEPALRAASIEMVMSGMPPADAVIDKMAHEISVITTRLDLSPIASQHRSSQWFQFLGWVVSAKDLLNEDMSDEEVAGVLKDGFEPPELTAEDRKHYQLTDFLVAGLQRIFPGKDSNLLSQLGTLCMAMRQEPEMREMIDMQLNDYLVQAQLVTGDADREEKIGLINELMDQLDIEEQRLTIIVVREDLDKYEAVLLEPNSDGKQEARVEMRTLLAERERLLAELSEENVAAFEVNTDRLNELREQIYHRPAHQLH